MIEGKSGLAIIRHALMDDLLAAMRVKDIGSQQFRALMDRAALILAVEAMRTLAVRPVQISAPFGSCSGFALRRPPIFISVLRAGNALLQAFTTLVPQGQVGFIGLERNPQTLEPYEYYCKLPDGLATGPVFVLDPMLATGNSMIAVLDRLRDHGCHQPCLVSLLGAPEGLSRIARSYPKLDIIVGALDEKLNQKGYIVPGLGDAGDRYFGTV